MSTTTSNRRLLVIGSQCEALGEGYRLKFLPPAAEELYTVLIDSGFILRLCLGRGVRPVRVLDQRCPWAWAWEALSSRSGNDRLKAAFSSKLFVCTLHLGIYHNTLLRVGGHLGVRSEKKEYRISR